MKMREIFTVFNFTFKEGVRKKVFIISSIIIFTLLIVGSIVGALLLNYFGEEEPVQDNHADYAAESDESGGDTVEAAEPHGEYNASMTCYVINNSQYENINGVLRMCSAMMDTSFIDGSISDAEAYTASIEGDPSLFMLEIFDGDIKPMLNFTSSAGIFDRTPPYDMIASVIDDYCIDTKMAEAGISEDIAALFKDSVTYGIISVGGMDFTGYIVGILLTIVVFFAVYYYGYGVAMSVAAEKTSRVMETLIMSAKPSHILIGKCLAMGFLGIIQLISMLIVSSICYIFAFKPYVDGMGLEIKLSSIGFGEMILIIVYFILGYTLYAMINSVCGASVSRTEDVNAALTPAMLVSLVSFYAGYMGIFVSGNTFRRIVSIVPFTSPFIMPFRFLNDNVAVSDIILSVLIMIAVIAAVTIISIKLYTASVMYYGQRLKIKDMFKLSSSENTNKS